MKLLELITLKIMENQNIITNKKYYGSFMIYSKKINTWIWCDENGKALQYDGDLIRVNLTKEIIEDNNWYVLDYPNKVIRNVIDEIVKNENFEKLSNTLAKVGVSIQNQDGSFRSMYDVMRDLSEAYRTMIDVENDFENIEKILHKIPTSNKIKNIDNIKLLISDDIYQKLYVLQRKLLVAKYSGLLTDEYVDNVNEIIKLYEKTIDTK